MGSHVLSLGFSEQWLRRLLSIAPACSLLNITEEYPKGRPSQPKIDANLQRTAAKNTITAHLLNCVSPNNILDIPWWQMKSSRQVDGKSFECNVFSVCRR
jgi:hypothetical protein